MMQAYFIWTAGAFAVFACSVVICFALCAAEDRFSEWKRRREARLDDEVAFIVDDY